ncbi:MAG TPA: ribosome maturation factor RimP, partial [Eubacterium sp.]|nr:ribosome maturation factor RimP [Eubacterium sp.]
MAKAQEIRQFTENVLADYLTEHGLELYHVDFRKEGKDWYLNVFVDRIQN